MNDSQETRDKTFLDRFETEEQLVELSDVDDLWYFVRGINGAWIAGSTHG